MKNIAGVERQELELAGERREAMVEGTSQAGITILVALAALVGIWGLACLVGGLADGGATELLRGWISAVSGV